MSEQNYSIDFEGYWFEDDKSEISDDSGIYCVYTCYYKESEESWYLNKLIYIGESYNVKDRLGNHERLDDWKKQLTSGEKLGYAVAKVSLTDRKRCEAALIFKHKPPVNTEYKYSFPYDTSTINLSGKTFSLITSFTVHRI